jgi:hypothetical protein
MHRLREHSCHSEYNVHCPKVFIDWFMMLVSLVLKLFVSSRPLKLEGVLCIYVLLSHKGQAKNYLYVFPYDLNTHLTCIVLFSWPFVCVLFHVITWLLNFFNQDYIFHAHVLSSFDPSAQRLNIWSLCRCMSPQKLFLLLSLTYSRTSRSYAWGCWYVSNVSIISDAPCLFLHHLLSVSLDFVAFLCIF